MDVELADSGMLPACWTVSPGVLGTVNFLGIFVFVVSQSLVLCGEMGEGG